MAVTYHKLSDGYEVCVYSHGGIDVKLDDGTWITVASTPQACADLARLAMLAAAGKVGLSEDEPGCALCREPATRTPGRCTHEVPS